MTQQCLISFGSNLGDRRAVLAEAAARIDRAGIAAGGLRTSRLFETPPIGGPGGQSPFLNAVGAMDTTATAADVLDVLQRIELELGRMRETRWSARVVDLDVVLHGQLAGPRPAGRRGLIGGRGPAGSSRALVVPHPRYTARRFVLQPACDVAADYVDPRFGWRIADLSVHLDADVPSIALAGGEESLRMEICQRLHEQHAIEIVTPRTDADAMSKWSCWVAAEVPIQLSGAVPHESASDSPRLPRLIAKIQRTTPQTRWPAPHQMWPESCRWPEYRLEVDDLDWAVNELASAIDSMRCQVHPVTTDGRWWS